MSSKTPPSPAQPTPSFDQRLQRLEAIVGELEQGGLALEPSIERYQEGVGLLRECRSVLQSLEKRVEELTAQGGLEPLAGDPDATGPGAPGSGGTRSAGSRE
ncbi:MAG: exodeoxyribonuclease VII small subunit [Rhodoglobus sp.]